MSAYNLRKRKQPPESERNCYAENKCNTIVIERKHLNLADDILVDVFKLVKYSQLAKCSLACAKLNYLIRANHQHLSRFRVSDISFVNVDHIPRNRIRGDAGDLVLKEFGRSIFYKEFAKWRRVCGYEQKGPLHNRAISQHSRERSIFKMSVLPSHLSYYEYDDQAKSVFLADIKSAVINTRTWPLYLHFFRLLTHTHVYFDKVSIVHIDFPVWQILTAEMVPGQKIRCGRLEVFDMNDTLHFSWIKDHFRCDEISLRNEMFDGNEAEIPADFIFGGAQCAKCLEVNLYYYNDIAVVSKIVEDFQHCREVPIDMLPVVVFNFRQHIKIDHPDNISFNSSQPPVQEQYERNGEWSSRCYEYENLYNSEAKLGICLKFLTFLNAQLLYCAEVKPLFIAPVKM
ncbi:hypothetical protein Ddc_18841 [Ditylenchus destructor]|nr:hypothetical protein Ddc_18841 [Ditylenchus destructor]